jgi:hypothetical protein
MTSNLADGRSQSTLLRRGAVVGLVVAIAGVAAGLTFSASLAHVIDTPLTQGWNFDVLVGNPNTQSDQQADGVPLLTQNPLVGGFTSIAMSLNGLT